MKAEYKDIKNTESISEYKVGNTLYHVQVYFNLESKNTLEDIIKKLIIKDVSEMLSV